MGLNTIYWASFNQDTNMNLEPKSLIRDMAFSQSGHVGHNQVSCPAIRDKHTNTFFSTFPYNLEVNFEQGLETNKGGLIEERIGLYKDSHAFDWHFKRIFFSSVPQVMETSPAFLHKTSYSKYGHAPSGAFDINRWFRPSAPSFQLWSGVKQFKASEGEAHLYFNFPSNEKVVLQEFKMTDTLYRISAANIMHKQHIPKENLNNLYERFTRSGLQKKVLSEIKANLA